MRIASTQGARKIELVFLGTRGEIKARSRRYRRHSALLVKRGRARIAGLASGASCPVYATEETFERIARFPIEDARIVEARAPFRIGGVRLEAFRVEHSLRAPAVGYRIDDGGPCVFYVPDVAAICDQHAALHGVSLYIGDGATIVRSMVHRRDHAMIGHAPIAAQLGWCEEEGVCRAIFTHCGSLIVKSDGRKVAARIADLGEAHGVAASIAYDGLTLDVLRRSK
jgi:hypothetical protein